MKGKLIGVSVFGFVLATHAVGQESAQKETPNAKIGAPQVEGMKCCEGMEKMGGMKEGMPMKGDMKSKMQMMEKMKAMKEKMGEKMKGTEGAKAKDTKSQAKPADPTANEHQH
jgi:hypothetical protein